MNEAEVEARKNALEHATHLATITNPPKHEQKSAAEIVKDAEVYLAFILSKPVP